MTETNPHLLYIVTRLLWCHIFYCYHLIETLKLNFDIKFEYGRPVSEIQTGVPWVEGKCQTNRAKTSLYISCLP